MSTTKLITMYLSPWSDEADLCEHSYSLSSSSRVLASFRSGVSKPSVNQL